MTQLISRATLAVALAAIAIAATPASAQTVADDARCLLVSNTYARTATTQDARVIAGSTSAFYLGRVDGRVPPAQLKAALAAQEKLLTASNGPAIMKACTERVGRVERTVMGLASPPAAGPSR